MSVERPCTWEESEHFAKVQAAIRSYFPTLKRQQLDSLRIAANGSTVFRSANGQLMVAKNLDVLTDDDAWFSRKKKPSPASASDLAAWRLISGILTAGAPSLLGMKLIELQVAYGTLKIGADGSLNCVVDAEPTELPRIEIDIPVPIHTDVIDTVLAEYRAELAETSPAAPFLAGVEPPTDEWRP